MLKEEQYWERHRVYRRLQENMSKRSGRGVRRVGAGCGIWCRGCLQCRCFHQDPYKPSVQGVSSIAQLLRLAMAATTRKCVRAKTSDLVNVPSDRAPTGLPVILGNAYCLMSSIPSQCPPSSCAQVTRDLHFTE